MLPDYHYLSLNALMQYKSSIFENYIPVYTDDDEHNLNVFEDILKKHFGYAGFKNIFQALATFYLSTGCKSLFLIGPTAIGKSAPIICNAIAEYDMATVLILPTIDLMIQFSNICRKAGLAYFSFNSKSSKQDKANLVKLASEDQSAFLKICRLLIVTPESFRTEDFKDILSSLARKKCLARIVVDECHLVYDQGYDFRKAFTKMLSDIQRAYTTQIVFTSASLSPQTIALFSDDCELIDNIVIRCASVKQNHMYFKFRKEDMICFNEYEDGFTRLKTLKESYFKDRSVKVIIVLRKIYELTKARNQYTSDLFELFEFHGDLDHEEKKRNKEMWERSSNAILLTVPSNLTGIDFQGCNVMIHHRDVLDEMKVWAYLSCTFHQITFFPIKLYPQAEGTKLAKKRREQLVKIKWNNPSQDAPRHFQTQASTF
uniref:Helicase ATP-binding domain-containing protein n=1 Tax=Strongyloides papillosus TaxID=174720 RepID=A0A0N5CH93_STREA